MIFYTKNLNKVYIINILNFYTKQKFSTFIIFYPNLK